MGKAAAYYRARPGAALVQAAAVASVVVLWLLGRYQLSAPVALWLAIAIMAAVVAAGTFSDFSLLQRPTLLNVHARIASMVLAVAVLTDITGWGPMLGVGYALAIFENIQRLGSKRWRAVMAWCLVGIGASVLAAATGAAPSFIGGQVLYALSGLNVVTIIFVAYLVGVLQAEAERSKESLALAAAHDHMTGLANRMAFLDALKSALAASRENPSSVAVLFCDLVDFKAVNDSFGHDVGDAVLVDVAARLSSCTRSNDMVARYAGDEFVVLVPDLESPRHAVMLARRIITSLDDPMMVMGHRVQIGVSIGIAVSSSSRNTVRALLHQADMAMYAAKTKGCSAWRLHVPGDQLACAVGAWGRLAPGAVDQSSEQPAAQTLAAGSQLSA